MNWIPTHKGDIDCRLLADRHYSRQTPGHPMFCRPGYNFVLKTLDAKAVWVWFRPKWESGIKGTMRKDGLYAIENTLFRNEGPIQSSQLIHEACVWLWAWDHAKDVPWPDGAITSINSKATAARRSVHAEPGHCFRQAGWQPFDHSISKRADIWLRWDGCL